ncbi:hypothetical protein PTSG_01007 [Salpingoeca rosetta]|uniref:Glutathione S-transferase n=1 Tax=Salpingoeca rosetta (strain ATCC 50818 / BSB-021) TaxID=946362 RepID=F2TY46_SALR5|nr:uncharacterized protein PTSG_01007 [Salpingoeca rosetta]EGD76305.1 hypothetical protein PTSG_01007 [Salpingoeca rosetta]|eukprot:XP_004998480.1 hypothetical protein PTSG_01007 [Salpingoeca rosetta]
MAMKLYYHEGKRGFAEKVRVMLAETGIKYEDVPVNRDQMQQMIKDGVVNFGMLPALEHDGKIIEQSPSIMEYIAEYADKLGLGQATNKYCGEADERPIVRSFAMAVNDFQTEAKTHLGKDGAPSNLDSVIIPKWFTYFQNILERNDDDDVRTDEYMYGKHLTFADIALFEAVNAVTELHGLNKVRPYPKLKEFHDKIAARARIEQFLATREQGQY